MTSTKHSLRIKTKRRVGEPWVSKNRVLNPNKAKRTCPIYRNPNFDTDETKLLIQLWGDPKIQRELITTHKKHLVIAQLASKMEEYGYYRSPDEITTRIKNMKCFYNRLKKEMETNPTLDPSWRHFADMEAIMTRPIFSVRPNEVPAPSLKYLMEQEEENRKDRKRKAVEEGIDISDSDDDIDDVLAVPIKKTSQDECIIPDADLEFECDDITLAAIANGTAEICDKSTKAADKGEIRTDEELLIKMEIESEEFQEVEDLDKDNNVQSSTKQTGEEKKDEANLVTPKDEPIEVEDESVQNDETINEQTTDAEKTVTISAPNLIEILNQPKSSQAITTNPVAIGNFSAAQSTCFTSNTNTTITSSPMIISNSSPSKISVVSPTILMPQAAQLSSSTDTTHSSLAGMRLGGNLQAFLTSSGGRQTMTAANGMKFILLNTGDQRKATTIGTPTMTLATPGRNIGNTTNVQVTSNIQAPQKVSQHIPIRPARTIGSSVNKSVNGLSTNKKLLAAQHTEKGDTIKRKELSGIKSTLMRLLRAREDGNELQAQRLAIERDRLQHERNVSEKYLAIFEQNQKFQQQLLQQQQQILLIQQQQQLLQAQQRPTTAQQLFATAASGGSTTAMQNSSQLMMPPKLLITTMVPTSAANATGGTINTTLGPKVITTANLRNVTNNVTPVVDKSLLIPKDEPDN